MAANTRFGTGINALVLLAREPNMLHSSESLAEKLHINSVVIRRILAQLQSGGIVRNRKGPAGGSELTRPAAKITLGEIYCITDPKPLFPTLPARGASARKLSDEMSKVQDAAEQALLRSLDETTLEQLVRKTARK